MHLQQAWTKSLSFKILMVKSQSFILYTCLETVNVILSGKGKCNVVLVISPSRH